MPNSVIRAANEDDDLYDPYSDYHELRTRAMQAAIEVLAKVNKTMHKYEELMYHVDLHSIMALMDEFIRYANKYWSSGIREAEANEDADARRKVLVDSFYLLRIATLLMHPVVPRGTERICDYMNFEFEDFFSWNYDFR